MKVTQNSDGTMYYEFEGQIAPYTWMPVEQKSPVQDGANYITITSSGGSGSTTLPISSPYTIDNLFNMRNQLWDTRVVPLGFGASGGMTTIATMPQPYLPGWAPAADPVPEQPSGRFRNLDWEEAS